MLLKQGGVDSFSFLEVLVIIKLHLEQGLQRNHIVKQLCQEGGRAGRPTLYAGGGGRGSHGAMEIMMEKGGLRIKIPSRMLGIVMALKFLP